MEEKKERVLEASFANLQAGQQSLEEAFGRQAELVSRIQMMAGSTNIEVKLVLNCFLVLASIGFLF